MGIHFLLEAVWNDFNLSVVISICRCKAFLLLFSHHDLREDLFATFREWIVETFVKISNADTVTLDDYISAIWKTSFWIRNKYLVIIYI